VLYRAVGNVLHHLPAPERSVTMLRRLVTRGPGGHHARPLPTVTTFAPVRWRVDPPPVLIPTEMDPFIDVCQAHRIWSNRLMGHWSRVRFDLVKLAGLVGRKPWYRPL
jgi:hypothetical protein